MNRDIPPTALITGGSAGLGLALVHALGDAGWQVITDARDARRLAEATTALSPDVLPVPGDVGDPAHRDRLAAAVATAGRLDLLVHNASALGPMLPLAEVSAELAEPVWRTNALAPLLLTRRLLPHLLASGGRLVGISSDAAVEHYPTWGLYAASKAALDQVILTLGAETGLTAYAVDPGDMRTEMHQHAFPGEDISDRPEPASVVPALMRLFSGALPSGRYRAADLAARRVDDPSVVA
ncbi:MAG: SDR family oxidoreductase [Nocardioides sp.]|uniref:SDR family oxidoreductase n=1 Tax=Nocardioides sp. TaxID=35761 RepID=UPI0039E611D6